MSEERMLHIALSKSEGAKYVFLPGSPQRVERIAKYLDNPSFLRVNREHETWSGELCGERVLVTSTGMGGPSSAIAMEELTRIGGEVFIRVGSCASVCKDVIIGDVVIPTSTVRMEGTGLHYAPLEYPAVPDIDVLDALRGAGKESTYPIKVGTVISRDGFYTQYEDENKPYSYELKNKWNSYKMMGAIATEMEASTLFLVGLSLGVKVGAVMVSATNYEKTTKSEGSYPMDYEKRAIEVALAAMKRLIKGM